MNDDVPVDSHDVTQELRAERDRLRTETAVLREALLAERRAHRLTQTELDDTYRQITEVFNSTAWRASSPIRVLGMVRRRMRAVPRLARSINKRRVKTAWRLFRQGELTTIAQRLSVVGRIAVPTVRIRHRRNVLLEPWPSEDPLVSVVVVCFNYGSYVAEAVDSVLRQTADRVEVIVVDGGSDDQETVGILHKLSERWASRVSVHFRDGRHQVGDNRNFGITRARGKYISCLDADDKLAPIYLEVGLFLLENHGYDLVSTTIGCFGQSEQIYGLLPFPDLSDMMKGNNVSTVGIFRRGDWERTGGYIDTGLRHEHTFEDWRFWMRLSALGARIVNIEQPLFHYRIHSAQSLSNQSGSVADMADQRVAIQGYNEDVLTPEAQERSRRRRETEYTVVDGTVNLLRPIDEHRLTVLIALPFLLVGGAERLVSGIMRFLRGRSIRIILITTVRSVPEVDGDSTDWFTSITDEVFALPLLLEQRRWAEFVRYLIASRRVDVLWLVGSEYTYQLLPELKVEFPYLGVVDQLFNTGVHAQNHRRHRKWIDATIVENQEVEQWLLTRGADAATVHRIDSGIDLSMYDPRSDDLIENDQLLTIGFSGRFSEEKGPDLFVDLAGHLRGRARFVMTGAGPMEGSTRNRARRLGLGNDIDFAGLVPNIAVHLRNLDVLVLPSRQDGRPVVVLEALASGVPVVAFGVGGLPELIRDGENGFLCPPGDLAVLSQRVQDLIENRYLLSKLKKGARRFAEEHLDASTMNSHYLSMFTELAETVGNSEGLL